MQCDGEAKGALSNRTDPRDYLVMSIVSADERAALPARGRTGFSSLLLVPCRPPDLEAYSMIRFDPHI